MTISKRAMTQLAVIYAQLEHLQLAHNAMQSGQVVQIRDYFAVSDVRKLTHVDTHKKEVRTA